MADAAPKPANEVFAETPFIHHLRIHNPATMLAAGWDGWSSPRTSLYQFAYERFDPFSANNRALIKAVVIASAHHPTGNCQIQTVAYMDAICRMYDEAQPSQRPAVQMLLYNVLFSAGLKAMALIDIYEKYEKTVIELFGRQPKTKTPYVSTNGSKMVLYLFETSFLSNRHSELCLTGFTERGENGYKLSREQLASSSSPIAKNILNWFAID